MNLKIPEIYLNKKEKRQLEKLTRRHLREWKKYLRNILTGENEHHIDFPDISEIIKNGNKDVQ